MNLRETEASERQASGGGDVFSEDPLPCPWFDSHVFSTFCPPGALRLVFATMCLSREESVCRRESHHQRGLIKSLSVAQAE